MKHPADCHGNPSGHELTAKQQKILGYFRTHQRKYGNWPTRREVGAAVGLTSSSSVGYHLQLLHRHGFLYRTTHGLRCYGLVGARIGAMPALPSIDECATALKGLIESGDGCAGFGASPKSVEAFHQASRGPIKSVLTSLTAQADAPAQRFTDA